MPGDLTISFLIDADNRAMDAEQDAFRWRVGDIVDALPAASVSTWDGSHWRFGRDPFANTRLAYLHLVDVPDRFFRDPERLARGVRVPVPEAPDPGEYAEIRARRYRVLRANLPTPRRNELRDQGETTISWVVAQVRDVIVRKTAVDRLARHLDTEATVLDTDE